MRIRRFAAVLAAGFAALAFNAARADVLIHVDKAAQIMNVSVDGEPLYTWKVSTGMADYDTPDGKFQAFRMERDHFSREWDDAPMPYSIFFTQEGHAIHGTNEVRHLGRPASHGCVRLTKEHAALLFDLVKQQGLKATRVELTGDIPAGNSRVIAEREPAKTYRAAKTDDAAKPADPVRIYGAVRTDNPARTYGAVRTDDDEYVAPAPRNSSRPLRVTRGYQERPRYFYYRGRTYVYQYGQPDGARRYGYRGIIPYGW